jgi:transposase
MARRPRRNHSAQFKAKVALEAIASDKTLAEIAQKYDVHDQIVDWKQQLVDRSAQVFGGDLSSPPVDLKILHAKIGQLGLENDFLESDLSKAGLMSAKK